MGRNSNGARDRDRSRERKASEFHRRTFRFPQAGGRIIRVVSPLKGSGEGWSGGWLNEG